MSTQTHDVETITERADRPVSIEEISEPLYRQVPVSLAEGDGRTLVSRLVPYGEVAVVDDGAGPYKEQFVAGAFKAQLRAASRIKAFLNFRHGQGLSEQCGHASKIEDRNDGLHGELRVLETPNGETALQLYHAGILDRLSIEFVSRKHRIVDDVVERLDARLLGVALVPEGAYSGAQVLTVRDAPEQIVDEELLPFDMDPGVVERLRRLGVALPEHYQAHPAEDTPSQDGTPETAPASVDHSDTEE